MGQRSNLPEKPNVNIKQAYERELARGGMVIYEPIEEHCRICGIGPTEVRVGVCFDCKEFLETDMKMAWDRRHPENRWPYRWAGPPRDVTPEEMRCLNDILKRRPNGKTN
jgi:hypothetical protein